MDSKIRPGVERPFAGLRITDDHHSRLGFCVAVTFFGVGQGDGAVIQFPDGKTMLVGGGLRSLTYDSYGIDRFTVLISSFWPIPPTITVGDGPHSGAFRDRGSARHPSPKFTRLRCIIIYTRLLIRNRFPIG